MGTSIIGAAELLGESLTASFADRLGLKRSIIIGIILSAMCYGILPFSSQTLPRAFISLFVLFLVFEFTIVSSLSLSTELLPTSRATMMSGFFAAAGLGRVIGSLIGSHIWLAGSRVFGVGIAGTASITSVLDRHYFHLVTRNPPQKRRASP
jgi:predicted MFS family arabinose efflux permease